MPPARPAIGPALAGALLAAWVAQAVAQEAPIGAPIASVRVLAGERDIDDAAIRALLETAPGRALSMADVRESLVHLHAIGRYSAIEVEATPGTGGVRLVYRVTPIREVRDIAFEGTLGLSEGVLTRALRERYGRAPRPERAEQASALLRDLYRDYGYLGASVTSRLEPEPGPDRARLLFIVQAGPRARVGGLKVEGEPIGGDDALLRALRVAPGLPWDAGEVRRRAGQVLESWRELGHYEAMLDFTTTPREGGTLVDVTLDAAPGPAVSLVFEGDPLPEARQRDLVPVRREGSVDEDLLEDSKRRIEDYLHGLGYWRAEVEYRREVDDGRLRVVFSVHHGRPYVVANLEIDGLRAVSREALLATLRTRVGDPFVQATLDADVAALRALYLERGFSAVAVAAAVEPSGRTGARAPGDGVFVSPRIGVTEGPQTRVGAIVIDGRAAVSETELRAVMRVKPGDPLYTPHVATDRSSVLLAYLNRGYRDALVDVSVGYSEDRALADLRYVVQEGTRARVDHVIVTGNRRIGAETILRELGLTEGDAAGLEAIAEGQRRLSATGLFRRVRVDEVVRPGSATRDVLVSVEEGPATTLGYGGGLEGGRRVRKSDDPTAPAEERFELAPRGFFEIGRRNLWGGNRSINLFTRVSLRPKDSSESTTGDIGGYGFKDYRILATYREPRSFAWDLEAQLAGVAEQGVRSSFDFRRESVTAELVRRLQRGGAVFGRYEYSKTKRFNERYDPAEEPLIDRLYPTVGVSSVSLAALRDTRLDPIDPVQGSLLGLEGELALKAIGSEVGFSKAFLQGYLYRQLPGRSRVVLATGARLGLAAGFPTTVPATNPDGSPVVGPGGQPVTVTVDDLPASERFYAGGDTTVRGYALDRLGDASTLDANGFPLGGNAVVILNAELRIPVWRSLGAVTFVDAGQVFDRADDLELGKIRPTVGVGIRFKSPVGPIRADLGVKLQPQTFADGSREPRTAFYISIGQAF